MEHLRVLLIDDERSLRQTFAYALREEGYRVWVAEDGQEGLDLFRSVVPHIVVTDILMPCVDGFTVIDTMRAENPGVSIVAMSGATGPVGQLQAERCGARVFLRKPVEIDALIQHLDDIATRHVTSLI